MYLGSCKVRQSVLKECIITDLSGFTASKFSLYHTIFFITFKCLLCPFWLFLFVHIKCFVDSI